MLAAASGADRASSSPCEIVLELLRATDTEHPFAFMLQEQSYVRHLEGGAGRSASFPWSERVLEHLAAIQRDRAAPAAAAWLSEEMRAFLDRLGWALDEERLRNALDAGRPVHITLRLGAAELYALPWELVPLGATGRPIGSIPGCLLQYEWPDTRTARPEPDPPPEGGRILFAWSAAGGVVPADEHLAALLRACHAGRHADFDRSRDVVPHASLGRLRDALRAAPVAVLHLLCHGGALDAAGASYGLVLDADGGTGKEIVDARALQLALADHLGVLRLVVLSACHGGNPGALDSRLGSVAQALHRAGIPAVVASRYPLAVDASVALTEALYQGLLADARSLGEAFLGARDRLRECVSRAGWASLQMYARAADGPDLRPIVPRPYRGLLAFQEQHARYFFGREAEVAEALGDLSALIDAQDAARPRLLICTGASGTGKSSLVLAGVVPALRARDGRWGVATLRPHDGWRASIQAALASRSDPGAPLLLVVDQFEELFTMISSNTEREAFVRELWMLASNPGTGVSVIATLRVDFLARCGEIKLWSGDQFLEDMAYDEAHRVFVRRMKAEHLRCTIERPAARAGLHLEEGLVAQMLKDAGDEPGALPLLEYTLDQMWQQRRGRLLTWDQYNALGGVGGALEKNADEILGKFDPLLRQAARRLLVQLVALDEGARLDRRRRVPLDRLRRGSPAEAAAFVEVLDALARERLLVLSGDDDAAGPGSLRAAQAAPAAGAAASRSPVVEVAHEQLLRSWGTLRAWVREDRQMLADLYQLDRWVDEAEGFPGYVLDGERLGHARDLLAKYPVDVGEAARALILRSERAARRKRRWFLGAAIAAFLAAVVMGVLAVWALDQRDDARMARDEAQDASLWALDQRDDARMARDEAQDASLISGARELLARNQPGPATALLLAVKDPDRAHGWVQSAYDILDPGGIPKLTLRGLTNHFTSATLSPDGKRIVIVSHDFTPHSTARVWRTDGSSAPIVLGYKDDAVLSAAFSPDSERIVIGCRDGAVRVGRADGSGTFVDLKGHTGAVFSVAFSPDGKRILTGSEDKRAWIWNADGSGRPVELKGHTGAVYSVAFSPDGKRILTFADTKARVWNGDGSGNPVVLNLPEVSSPPAFSSDSQRILIASFSAARVWNADGSGVPFTLDLPADEGGPAALSPDGKWVATPYEHTVRVWDTDIPRMIFELKGHTGRVTSAVFSPDGKRILTTSEDGTVRLWNMALGVDPIVLRGHEAAVLFATFSHDGTFIVTVSADHTVRVWPAHESGDPRMSMGNCNLGPFSPDGKYILATPDGKHIRDKSDANGPVYVWGDAIEPVYLWSIDGSSGPVIFEHILGARSAAFSPDGKRIVTTHWFDDIAPPPEIVMSGRLLDLPRRVGEIARVWSADRSGDHVTLAGHKGEVLSAAFSPDGKRIVTASSDGTARVWSADGSGLLVELPHSDRVTTAAFSPDGRRILTASDDKIARVWSSEGTGVPVAFRHDARIIAAAFSPDGKRILTAAGRSVRVWSSEDDSNPITLEHPTDVDAAVFSPDGQHIVTRSGGVPQVAQVWSADRSGKRILLPGTVGPAPFSPDGKRILTLSDRGASVWSVDGSDTPIALSSPDRVRDAFFSPDGRHVALVSSSLRPLVIREISIDALQRRLREATEDCLLPEMRQAYLRETATVARARYEECERDHGRTPLPLHEEQP